MLPADWTGRDVCGLGRRETWKRVQAEAWAPDPVLGLLVWGVWTQACRGRTAAWMLAVGAGNPSSLWSPNLGDARGAHLPWSHGRPVDQ